MSATVLVTDHAWPSLDVERQILKSVDATVVDASTGTGDDLSELARDADAILTNWRAVSAEVLQNAKRCITVARYGVGLDNIDVDKATELGIIVSNVPSFCTEEVADHTMALILAHLRNIGRSGSARSGQWNHFPGPPMHRVAGRVLGLVGCGRIAIEVAKRATAFGLEVIAFSPSRVGSQTAGGVRFVPSLNALLHISDIVSLHVPLTPSTRGLMDREKFERMKQGSLIVNCSRGALINEADLVNSLEKGHLGGAALDVLDLEPPSPSNPLLGIPTVIVTPHVAFRSIESIAELQETAAWNVAYVLRGEAPPAVVNPSVLTSQYRRVLTTRRCDGYE